MPDVVSETVPAIATSELLAAELEAYNRAFCELELPWQWDAQTFRHLVTVAPDRGRRRRLRRAQPASPAAGL